MKSAFLIMGDFNPIEDCSSIKNGAVTIVGVGNVEQACEVAKDLISKGIDLIEVCGAFTETNVKRIISETNNRIPIGYVTHLKEQDNIFKELFCEKN